MATEYTTSIQINMLSINVFNSRKLMQQRSKKDLYT